MLIPGLSHKTIITTLAVAFFILLGCGCLKYCAKASNSLGEKGAIAKAPQKPAKLPTPRADNVLTDFQNDIKQHFQYVVLISNSEWGDFLNDHHPVDTAGYAALSGEKTSLRAKRLATLEIKTGQISEDQTILTPDFVGRILDGLGENWYLDWDKLRDTFRPLTIRLKEGLPQSRLQDIIGKVLEDSNAQSLVSIQPTPSENPDKLSHNLEAFLETVEKDEVEKRNFEPVSAPPTRTTSDDTQEKREGSFKKVGKSIEKPADPIKDKKDHGGQSPADSDSKRSSKRGETSDEQKSPQEAIQVKVSPELKQRLAFISPSPIEECYVIFYLKDNNYGTLVLHKKIGWNPDGQAIVMNKIDFVNVLSQIFELDAPTLVLKDKDQEMKRSVDEAMTARRGVNGKLNEMEHKKLRELLTAELMKKLKK